MDVREPAAVTQGYDDFARATAAARQRTLGAQFPQGEGTGNWVGFAALILSLAGLFNALDGILAITHSRVYPAVTTFAFGDLRTWGWIALVLGIVQVCAALGLMSGRPAARWFAIACASVNAIGQLFFMSAHEQWGLAVFALDVFVLYALTARWTPPRARA